MTYSSALFLSENETLKEVQINKYDRILDELNAKVGDEILEVGCGWGGFLERAATKGFKPHGITISQEQYVFAKKRLMDLSNASLGIRDYRDIEKKYDHIVSIEMFEALGIGTGQLISISSLHL